MKTCRCFVKTVTKQQMDQFPPFFPNARAGSAMSYFVRIPTRWVDLYKTGMSNQLPRYPLPFHLIDHWIEIWRLLGEDFEEYSWLPVMFSDDVAYEAFLMELLTEAQAALPSSTKKRRT